MECCLTIKGKEILIYATTYMNVENILSERSQTQKVTCCMKYPEQTNL